MYLKRFSQVEVYNFGTEATYRQTISKVEEIVRNKFASVSELEEAIAVLQGEIFKFQTAENHAGFIESRDKLSHYKSLLVRRLLDIQMLRNQKNKNQKNDISKKNVNQSERERLLGPKGICIVENPGQEELPQDVAVQNILKLPLDMAEVEVVAFNLSSYKKTIETDKRFNFITYMNSYLAVFPRYRRSFIFVRYQDFAAAGRLGKVIQDLLSINVAVIKY